MKCDLQIYTLSSKENLYFYFGFHIKEDPYNICYIYYIFRSIRTVALLNVAHNPLENSQ